MRRSIGEGTAAKKFALHFGKFALPDPEGAAGLIVVRCRLPCDSCPKLDVCSDALGEFFGRVPLRFKAMSAVRWRNLGFARISRCTWRELLCCSHRTQEVAHFNLQPVALGG